jgi:hypothetical protein
MNDFFNNKDLLQLLIEQVDDGLSYFRLMQVNKLSNTLCKKMLIHKTGNNGKRSKRRRWTEIPGLPGLVNGQIVREDGRGKVMYRFGFIDGKQHGISVRYDHNSQPIKFVLRYQNGQCIENVLLTIRNRERESTQSRPSFKEQLGYIGFILGFSVVVTVPIFCVKWYFEYW